LGLFRVRVVGLLWERGREAGRGIWGWRETVSRFGEGEHGERDDPGE
jgi:hypothetical protein